MIAEIDRYHGIFTIAFFGVALVLIAMAMASVPICTYDGPPVNLPWAKTASFLVNSERDLQIRVFRTGNAFVGPMPVPESQVESALRDIYLRTPGRRVVVQADRSLKLGQVQHVLAAAGRAGFQNIYLVTFRGTALEALAHGSER